jgi:putative ABC transport system ATP-binding protein
VSFTVGRGRLTALRGRSGSGKTTLLNIIGGLDSPTAGQVWVDGREVSRMTERERLALRRDTVAFHFPVLWAHSHAVRRRKLWDSAAPPPPGGGGATERIPDDQPPTGADAMIVCDRLVRIYSGHGIEVQALQGLDLLLAQGELTALIGAAGSAHEVFSALQTANTELGVTVLVVTHDPAVSSQVRRTIAIRDGRTSSETIRHAATDEHGRIALHAREYATLDRAGRIQLPREMTTRLRLRHRVQLQEEPDHIGVWPDQAAHQERDHRTPNS